MESDNRFWPDSSTSNLAQLRSKVDGDVMLPADLGYDEARKVWNGAVDKRPAMIVYCAHANDVAEAVNFARAGNHLVAVRSGGHNVAGLSVCDDGVVIDLSRMKRIAVDPVRRTAQAEAGLNLGEFDAATQAHGLATTMGVNGVNSRNGRNRTLRPSSTVLEKLAGIRHYPKTVA